MWRSSFVFGIDESQSSKTASNQSIFSISRFQKVRFFLFDLSVFSLKQIDDIYNEGDRMYKPLRMSDLLRQFVTHWGSPSVWAFRNSRKFQGKQNSKLLPPECLSQVLNDWKNIHSDQNHSYVWGRTVTAGYPIHLYLKSENCRHKHRFGSRH